MVLFGGWTGADLSEFPEDEDFKFTKLGGIQSMINSWSSTVPGSQGVKWTKSRIASELALGPHPKAIGSAATVADILEERVETTGIDGFNCSYAGAPADWQATIKYLFPELHRRGVFHTEYSYPGGSTRENHTDDGKGPKLRGDHPGSQYKWGTEAGTEEAKSFGS
jgi:hypothetical protein